MNNIKIRIDVTNGEKFVRATISVEDYLKLKNESGISLLDKEVDIILKNVDFTEGLQNKKTL